jgi:septum formation protein
MTSRQLTTKRLILASASPYRRVLLERLQVEFSIEAADIDEYISPEESAHQAVLRLAEAKARKIADLHPDVIVIGSDQIALLGEKILGKPHSVDQAREQLRNCSGKGVDFLTAICVTDGDRTEHDLDITRVKFRSLDEQTIERYVEADRPLDCAGAIRSEGLGIALCDAVESRDPAALMGLPLIALSRILRGFGYQVP